MAKTPGEKFAGVMPTEVAISPTWLLTDSNIPDRFPMMAETSISFSQSVICWSMLSKGDYLLFYGLTKETGKQGYKGGSDESDTAASHELFHPQLGVKTLLDGGRRRTKNLYGVVKRTVPAGQVRQ